MVYTRLAYNGIGPTLECYWPRYAAIRMSRRIHDLLRYTSDEMDACQRTYPRNRLHVWRKFEWTRRLNSGSCVVCLADGLRCVSHNTGTEAVRDYSQPYGRVAPQGNPHARGFVCWWSRSIRPLSPMAEGPRTIRISSECVSNLSATVFGRASWSTTSRDRGLSKGVGIRVQPGLEKIRGRPGSNTILPVDLILPASTTPLPGTVRYLGLYLSMTHLSFSGLVS